MTFVLLMLSAGALPQSTLGRLPQSTLPAVAPKAIPGLHTHKCPRCSWQWSHGSAENNKIESHLCPKCGTLTWKIDHWGDVQTQAPTEPPCRL